MEQGTEEWRKARMGMPSASRLDAILAEGKGGAMAATYEDYLYEVVLERITGIPYEQYHSVYMDDGKDNEDLARTEYEARFGVMVELHPGKESKIIPGFWASPDGLLPSLKKGMEIKCKKSKNHMKAIMRGLVERPHILQMTGNLLVFDEFDAWDYVSFDPSFPENLRMWVRTFPKEELPIAQVMVGIENFLRDADALEKTLRAA